MSMDAAAEKQRLRKLVRERLAVMTPEEFRARSAGVGAEVQRVGDDTPGGALVFLPDHREPDIEPVIAAWLSAGRLVAAPRCDWERGAFEPVRLRSLDDVVVRRFQVREPASRERVNAEDLGLALVPGTAFDNRGGRLGRGGGFYDRFLAELPPTVRRLGVCFAAQIVDRVPIEAHDAPVDALATEEGLISAKGGRGGDGNDR